MPQEKGARLDPGVADRHAVRLVRDVDQPRAVYKTADSAQFADGDKYHDNCHCVAEPIFTRELAASGRYALNRLYGQQRPQVTRGLLGKAALRAGRRFIRQQQATADRAEAASNAQEA